MNANANASGEGAMIAPTTMIGGNDRDGGRYNDASASSQIDFRKLLADLIRNKWTISAIILFSLIAAAVLTAIAVPQYQARTTIEVDPRASKVLNVEDVQAEEDARGTNEFLQTQLQMLKSRSLAEAVAEDLGYLRDNRFLNQMNAKVPSAELRAEAQMNQRRDLVVDTLLKNLQVALIPSSMIVEIKFTSPSASMSANIVNSYAENYIKDSLTRRLNVSSYAREYLSDQLVTAKKKLEESEKVLNDYARSHGLVTLGSTGDEMGGKAQTLTSATLTQINNELASATAERITAEQKWARAQAANAIALPNVHQNSAITQLLARKASLKAEYAQNGRRWKKDYPQMLQTEAEIAQIDRELASISSTIKSSVKDEYLAAVGKEQALLAAKNKLASQQLSEQDSGVQFSILSREVSTNRALYDGLLQRFKELNATAGLTGNNISIVDEAVLPRGPVSPNALLNMILGLVTGIILAGLYVLGKEQIFGRIRTPDELQKYTRHTVLTSIPLADADALESELRDIKSPVSEAYHMLKSALALSTTQGAPAVMSITSGRGSEGKSTTAVEIAKEFVRAGKKVLIVDGDLRRPSLHTRLGLTNKVGFSDVLTAQSGIHEATQHYVVSDKGQLAVITSGVLPPNPPQLLSSSAFTDFIQNTKSYYDHVIIDSPPLLGLADSHIIASIVDASVYVVQSGMWSGPQMRSMLDRFSSFNNNIVGLVLTKFDPQAEGYYDYYHYSYNY